MRKSAAIFLLATLTAGSSLWAQNAFQPGDIAVYQVGDGSTTLSSNATPVFIDEYTPGGTLVQSIPIPGGASNPLTDSGTASSDGELTLSTNSQYLVFTGYGATSGTASITTSTSIARVAGTLNVGTGAVDTSTQLTAASTYSGNNIRGAASMDGQEFWLAGTATSTGGIRYATLGSTTSSQVESTVTNTRAVNIFNGQLYLSTGATTPIYQVGTGTPTSGATATALSGVTVSGTSSTGFYLTPDGSRLFVADGAGTIQEFVNNAGNFMADKSLTTSGAPYQLTGATTGGVTTLYFTTKSGTAGNSLYSDTFNAGTDAFSTPTSIATAGINETFKGVELLAVPEPATWGMMVSGMVLLLGVQRLRSRKS
jgi:hypothetical protein